MVLSILRFGIEIVLIDYTTLHHNISPTLLENHVTPFSPYLTLNSRITRGLLRGNKSFDSGSL